MNTLKFKTQELTDVHWTMAVPAHDAEAVSRMSADEQEEYLNDHQHAWVYGRQGTSETVELAGSPVLEEDS